MKHIFGTRSVRYLAYVHQCRRSCVGVDAYENTVRFHACDGAIVYFANLWGSSVVGGAVVVVVSWMVAVMVAVLVWVVGVISVGGG